MFFHQIFMDIDNITTILVIIFRDFLMFYQIFLSPQAKRTKIISNKHGIYNDLRLRKLGNDNMISNLHRIIA